jgi:hypothetical protein
MASITAGHRFHGFTPMKKKSSAPARVHLRSFVMEVIVNLLEKGLGALPVCRLSAIA